MNHHGDNPQVSRVDVIAGEVRGPLIDRHASSNQTTKVIARRAPASWVRHGDEYEITLTLPPITRNMYVRIRGTNSPQLEPLMDAAGEDPWTDLWFYSNPVFINAGVSETQP